MVVSASFVVVFVKYFALDARLKGDGCAQMAQFSRLNASIEGNGKNAQFFVHEAAGARFGG